MVRSFVAGFSSLGIAGSCISTTVALGCCAPSVLGPIAGVVTPLVLWLPSSVDYEVLYASIGITLVGLVVNAIRQRRTASLMLGMVGTAALLAALHDAWDIGVFRMLIWSGALTLVLVAITDVQATIPRRAWRGRSATCAT